MRSLCWLPMAKNHYLWQILTFGGLMYRLPFTGVGQIWCAIADVWYTLTCRFFSRSVYSVTFWRRKLPIFAIFWTSAFCCVASWQQSEKVEHGCTTTSLPLSNGIKIVSPLQRYLGEIVRTISNVHKRDKQTDKKQRFGRPGGG